MEKKITVSIICITYNHEKYIEKCLKGLIMQKTLFDYEILIHEDASSDKTPEIIKKYEKKYSNLIKVIYQKENQFSQGKSPSKYLYDIAQGKYLAFCEGDDYWIDENKLQKQVTFLEENRNYSAIYSNVLIVDENNKIFNDKRARQSFPLYDNFVEKKYLNTLMPLLGQISGMTCVNFWKIFSEDYKKEFLKCKANGDVKIYLLLKHLGNIYFSREITSCYRRTYIGNSWNARTLGKNMSEYFYNIHIELAYFLEKVFNFKMELKTYLLDDSCSALFYFIKNPTRENLKIFYNLYKKTETNIFQFSYFFIKKVLKKLKLIKSNNRPLYKGKIILEGKRNL